MKNLAITLIIIVAVTGLNACKKCGYCDFGANGTTSAYCKGAQLIPGTVEEYDYQKADCSAKKGTWVNVK